MFLLQWLLLLLLLFVDCNACCCCFRFFSFSNRQKWNRYNAGGQRIHIDHFSNNNWMVCIYGQTDERGNEEGGEWFLCIFHSALIIFMEGWLSTNNICFQFPSLFHLFTINVQCFIVLFPFALCSSSFLSLFFFFFIRRMYMHMLW